MTRALITLRADLASLRERHRYEREQSALHTEYAESYARQIRDVEAALAVLVAHSPDEVKSCE